MSDTTDRIDALSISLGEFLTRLVLELDSQDIPMPFQNEEKWHRLFNSLKSEPEKPGRPAFLKRMRFDWDGTYPKSQDLSEYLQAMHWNGFISVANPTYDRLRVDEDVKAQTEKVRPNIDDKALEKFVTETAGRAAKLFR